MAFKNFVCWSADHVSTVMNTEALQTADHIFLATHSPLKMNKQSLTQSLQTQALETYDEQQFLTDFLNPNKDFAFVTVLGGAGAGKSHLIRWLSANIKETASRKVLLIPRSLANLRAIIKKILDFVEVDRAEEYRKRLTQTTEVATMEESKTTLLNHLAARVQHGEGINENDEEEDYLIEKLPALLYDQHFRDHLLEKGAIIEKLTKHIIGSSDVKEYIKERREFLVSDLPLNVSDISKAGKAARELYGCLVGDQQMKEKTVALLNHHLDHAIRELLQISREDLTDLMRDIREALAKQNVELILLIEDFAKLQGIDRQVLASVIERPKEKGRPDQCAIRTALACTTGYFQNLQDTVRHRTTFSVSLDVEVGTGKPIRKKTVIEFVAKYLNATRLPEKKIREWHNSGATPETIPNQCEECEYHDPCHMGFGESNGIGLYPFNKVSIERMLSRVNEGATSNLFVPRLLIKDVLKYTLENHAEALKNGEFPLQSLSEHFGGTKLSPALNLEIEDLDKSNASRRKIVIDLWLDGNGVQNLDKNLHTAFNLPALTEVGSGDLIDIEDDGVDNNEPQVNKKLSGWLDEIQRWSNGEHMPQTLGQKLREHIYPAIRERISWTSELLLQSRFTGKKAIFRQNYVNFNSWPGGTPPHTGVGLLIGKESSKLNREAVALQAILNFEHFGSWKYEGGSQEFRIYARCLEDWSRDILSQIRNRSRKSGEVFNIVPVVVELLAIGAKMAGFPSKKNATLSSVVNSLFSSYDIELADGRTRKWRELFKAFAQNREKLMKVLESYTACAKGTGTRLQIIDVTQLLPPLKDVIKSWTPQTNVPEDLRSDLKFIKDLRDKVDQFLIEAIEEEKQRHIDWRNRVDENFGHDREIGSVLEKVLEVSKLAKDSGNFNAKNQTSGQFQYLLRNFNYQNTQKHLVAIDKIENEPELGNVFTVLSLIPQDTLKQTDHLISNIDDFLERTKGRVDIAVSNLSGGQDFDDLKEEIEEELTKLNKLARGFGKNV